MSEEKVMAIICLESISEEKVMNIICLDSMSNN